jgi:hypothetical protein
LREEKKKKKVIKEVNKHHIQPASKADKRKSRGSTAAIKAGDLKRGSIQC